MLSKSELSNSGNVYDYSDDVHHNTDIFKSFTEITFYGDQDECDFCDSSSEDEDKPGFSLRDELKEWAISSNTPLSCFQPFEHPEELLPWHA